MRSRSPMDFAAFMWLSCNNLPRPACRGSISESRSASTMSDDSAEREQGARFLPKFDGSGLLTGVVTHAVTGEVLMVAFMDAQALEKTRETGLAHFHSRSRGRLWMKGETSGHVLRVQDILVDCDQDALVLKVIPAGPTCHTGATSCFYRVLADGTLQPRSS